MVLRWKSTKESQASHTASGRPDSAKKTWDPGASALWILKRRAVWIVGLLLTTAVSIHGGENNGLWTLKDCLDLALKQSPLIRSSGLEVQAAQASLRASKGALFPRIDLNGLTMKENQPVPYVPAQSARIPAQFSDEFYSWGLYLRLPLYEGGRLVKQVEISKMEIEIQSSREKLTLQDVVANVTNTFNKLLQLKQLRGAQEQTVAALEGQVNNTALLVKTGRTANVELLRIDVQLASEKQNLIRTVEAISRAKDALAFFMGLNKEELKDIDGALKADEGISGDDIDGLLKSRPDVAVAVKRVEQGRLKVAAASGRRYHSLSLVGDYGNRAGAAFNDRTEIWEVGLVASINLFDGGIISSEIEREKVLLKKAEEELRLTELKARLEVDSALSARREAEARLHVARRAVAQAEEGSRIEGLKYKTGAGTVTDTLLAQSARNLAEANYVQALYDYNTAIVEFKKATGTIEVK